MVADCQLVTLITELERRRFTLLTAENSAKSNTNTKSAGTRLSGFLGPLGCSATVLGLRALDAVFMAEGSRSRARNVKRRGVMSAAAEVALP